MRYRHSQMAELKLGTTAVVLVLIAVVSGSAQAQQASVSPPSSNPTPAAITLDEIVKRAVESETAIITNLQAFKPIVEVYIQNVVPDEALVVTPNQDTYFLGRFNWRKGPGCRR